MCKVKCMQCSNDVQEQLEACEVEENAWSTICKNGWGCQALDVERCDHCHHMHIEMSMYREEYGVYCVSCYYKYIE